MKVKAKNLPVDGNNRVSALQRLSKPGSMNKTNIHQRLSAPTNSMVTDARQLLSNRNNKPVFDARQLLSRQSSKTMSSSLIIRNNMEQDDDDDEEVDEEEEDNTQQKTVVLMRSNNGRLTADNSDRLIKKQKTSLVSTEPIFFTKTIPNSSADNPSSDNKVVISIVNDQYRKRARSPSPSPPPVIKRLNDASIQTGPLSSSSFRRDLTQPSAKRTTTAASKTPIKQTSTSTRSKPSSTSYSNSATILITNLQSSVTEEDVNELFSEIGPIDEILTLSRGCIQVVYSKQEDAEEAVAKYHNRVLDGQLMYVSLQQPLPPSSSSSSSTTTTKSSKNSTESSKTTSNKISIDPAFIRQALFNPSNNTTNPVQFQVKL